MEYLLLFSFYLFNVLLCPTTYCVPFESVGGSDVLWKYSLHNDGSGHPFIRGPRPTFANLAELCTLVNPVGNKKLLCLLCKGFDISCLITTTTVTSTSSTTTPASTSPVTITVPSIPINPTINPAPAPQTDAETA